MHRAGKAICTSYREEVQALLARRGRAASEAYDSSYRPATLAMAATAAQIATIDRLATGAGGPVSPFRSTSELRTAASQVPVPPDGQRVGISRNMLETVVAQPSLANDRLGPLPGAATRTLGRATRDGILVPVTVLLTISRTIEALYMRSDHTVGARTDGRQELATVVGATPYNGGAALLYATHPQLQDVDDEPYGLISYHAERLKLDLEPLDLRLRYLNAVWHDLHETLGLALPIVQRAERRFDAPEEGSATSDDLWYATNQPCWRERVEQILAAEAIVLGECDGEWMRGLTYRSRHGERRISNPAAFMRDVELKLYALDIHQLEMSDPAAERELSGADRVVVLGGELVDRDHGAYRAVVVPAVDQAESILYAMPSSRATQMNDGDWDKVRTALASLHGTANDRSSDDQGLGLRLPYEHALSLSSTDWDKLGNYDALRCFSHALERRSHWQPDDDPAPPPKAAPHDTAQAA